MTVYDPSWKHSDDGKPRIARAAFLGYMLMLVVLWLSHSNLSAKIHSDGPEIDTLGVQLDEVQTQMQEIESVIGEHAKDLLTIKLGEVQRTAGVIALDNPEALIIGQGFAVTRLKLEPLGQGVFISGRIINLQAVKHDDVVFRIKVGQESAEFTIEQIEAGQSRQFSVFLPTMEFEHFRYARIDYRESTIWHHAVK